MVLNELSQPGEDDVVLVAHNGLDGVLGHHVVALLLSYFSVCTLSYILLNTCAEDHLSYSSVGVCYYSLYSSVRK